MKHLKLLTAMLGLITLGLLLLLVRGSMVPPITSDFGALMGFTLGRLAHVDVTGEFEQAYLVSPTGETTDLREGPPIFVPTGDIDAYKVRLEGSKGLFLIFVTSFDGKRHPLYVEGDEYHTKGGIEETGNTAITIYDWD